MPRLKLRPQVLRFAEAMERGLRRNEHKGGWRNEKFGYLMDCLHDEANELAAAVMADEDAGRVLDEAADVGNFAMMVADNARALEGQEKKTP